MFYDFVTVWTTLPMDLLDSQIAHWIQKFAKVAFCLNFFVFSSPAIVQN